MDPQIAALDFFLCAKQPLEYQCKLHQAGIWLHPEPARRMSREPNKKKGATLRCPGARVALFFFECQVSLRRAFVVHKGGTFLSHHDLSAWRCVGTVEFDLLL